MERYSPTPPPPPPPPPPEEEVSLGPTARPCLIFPTRKDGKFQTFYNLSEPNNKIYKKCIPELTRTSFWLSNSHQGWLIIVCDDPDYQYSIWKYGDCFLWNLESFETIQLPNVLKWIQNPKYSGFHGFVLSSPPINSDSIVSFISGNINELVFCFPSKDKQWRTHKLHIESDEVLGLVLFSFKGKLHISGYKNFHCLIEKKLHLDNDVDESYISVTPLEVSLVNVQRKALNLVVQRHCIESSDELFMVIKYVLFEEVFDLKVFKMDFSNNKMRWEEVHTLDDHVLFLGKTTTASCSATELGLTNGCIYYTQSQQQNMLFKFDIECKTISVSCLPCSEDLSTLLYTPEWMLLPTDFRFTEGRRKSSMLGSGKDADSITGSGVEEMSTCFDDGDQKRNGGKLKQMDGAWATLNENVIGLIASYLHPVDHLHFRAVCKENQSAIPLVKWRMSSTEIVNSTLPPWLVYSRKNDTIYNFVDPMHNNERHLMNLPEFLLDSTIRFSKGGWLLMSKGEISFFFFNPFTRATIQLPDLPIGRSCLFAAISFSYLPTSRKCRIFVCSNCCTGALLISSIRIGHRWWRLGYYSNTLPSNEKHFKFLARLNNPVFYHGKFYVLDHYGRLGVFSGGDFKWEVLAEPQTPCDSIYQCYLVECKGELLSVFVGHFGKWVRIYRLDYKEMVWVEVKSLQKNMLFISNTSCLSATAPNTSMGNRIYFPRFRDENIMFFSLDTGKYHFVGSQHSFEDFYNTKEQLYCSWIEPNWSNYSNHSKGGARISSQTRLTLDFKLANSVVRSTEVGSHVHLSI